MGPTGLGKSCLAELLAEHLRGGADRLARLDMAAFSNDGAIWALLGSAAGYVGHAETPGKLAAAVRNDPVAVILFGEIDKAHPAVWRLLLGILETGRALDSRGNVLDLQRAVIVLTANLEGRRSGPVGSAAVADAEGEDLASVFPRELVARVEVVRFVPLGPADLAEIARRRLKALVRNLPGSVEAPIGL